MPLPPPSPPPVLHRNVMGDGRPSNYRPLSPMTGQVNGYDYNVDGSYAHMNMSLGPGAEDVAHDVEDSHLGDAIRVLQSRGRGTMKRHAFGTVSEGSSDHENSHLNVDGAPANKRRRVGAVGASDITEDLERSIAADHLTVSALKVLGVKVKGKGKLVPQREMSYDSISVTPSARRRRVGPRRKLDHLPPERFDLLGLAHAGGSGSGDVSPGFSRPASPATTLSIVYELDEIIPPLKRAKKVDDAAMLKRVKVLEEAQRKVWTNIARRDVAKVTEILYIGLSKLKLQLYQVYKYHAMGYQARQAQLERIARLASIQARKPFTRTAKGNKDIQAKAKRLMREMLVFWKKNEREERDVRKREQKEAIDRAKIEEEKREAARQARKLEFLISQTELYSHFVGSKLKSTLTASCDMYCAYQLYPAAEVEGEAEATTAPVGADIGYVEVGSLKIIDFDEGESVSFCTNHSWN
jgi:DNA helicase INO80